MRTKKLIILMTYSFLTITIWSFDLSLAELYQYSPDGNDFTEINITRDLFKSVRETDNEGVLSLSRTNSKDIPKSILDAALLSESENNDFILYGFLKVSKNYYDFEVKLYDREGGEIKTVFYAKNSSSNYDELIKTMSMQIVTYFHKTLGVTSCLVDLQKEHGVIDIESGLGYWIPFYPWAESLMGLVSVHVASSLTPVNPLFKWDIFTFALGYGIGVDYSLGMNKEGFEAYSLHSVRLGFPVTLSTLWHYSNKLIFSMAPELQVDVLIQDRLYGSLVSEKSTALSLCTSIGYEYLFTNKRFSLGFATRLHTTFYTNILFSIEPSFYCRYRFNPANKAEAWSEASFLLGHITKGD
ncbi:MAG: hypothetical protein PF693_14300 [Spirochaetia bacterium]|jgi:hypothetical protein|nr:hypothetical protein [Spirochaetia bacterium]